MKRAGEATPEVIFAYEQEDSREYPSMLIASALYVVPTCGHCAHGAPF